MTEITDTQTGMIYPTESKNAFSVEIHSEESFKSKILPHIEKYENTFFISILDPNDETLYPPSEVYKTVKFYDVIDDVGNYNAISFEQAKEIKEFCFKNKGKKLIVHCGAGVSRSAAVAEWYFELLGGSYKQLTDRYKYILPNPRVLSYLRMAEKENNLKINFI